VEENSQKNIASMYAKAKPKETIHPLRDPWKEPKKILYTRGLQ